MHNRRRILVLRATSRKRRVSSAALIWLAGVVTMLLWLFISLNPFQPANPFLREITIGQSVLGDWRYGGTIASGSMRFYDAYYQYVELPATATTFAADGMFVRIDGHTPTTLTFEPVVESETIGPAIIIALALLAVAPLWAMRRTVRKRRGMGRRWRLKRIGVRR